MTTFINSKALKVALGLVVALAFVASAASAQAYTFTRTLKKGMSGADVKAAQQILNSTQYKVAASGVGSTGHETLYFGAATEAAVKAFQVGNNIVGPGVAGYGWIGPRTQLALNNVGSGSGNQGGSSNCQPGWLFNPYTNQPCSGGSNGGPVVAGAVSASLATDNPASGYLATGTANNPVLKVSIANGSSASVNVTGIKLTKSGFYTNTDVTGVAAYDAAGVRHGNVISSLGFDGSALLTFSSDPIVVPAGSSTTVTFRINLSGSNTGTISFGVMNPATDIMLSAGAASGSAVMGNLFSVVNGGTNIASVTVDVQPVNPTGVQVNADGTSVQTITKFRVTNTGAGTEDAKLFKLTLWNNGNAADTDLKDVQLFDQTNNLLATTQMSNKMATFDLSAAPYLIAQGQSKDFTVKAKFVNGASRTVQFVVYNDYDLDVRGATTMASVLPTHPIGYDTTVGFPVGDQSSTYNKVTIGSGSLVLSRASDSPATSVVPGASNIVLAKYIARPVGENMEVRGMSFGIDQSAGSAVNLTGTVYVKVNGAIVFSGAASGFANNGTAAARSLSSYPILTAGVDNAIEISATLSSSADATDAYQVKGFDITSVKRLITNDIYDPLVSGQDGFNRAVQAASLTVTTLTTPVATTIVPGAVDAPLASVQFNASSSGEPVQVSSLVVTDTKGTNAVYTDVYNLVMKDASGQVLTTTSSTTTNANTVTFDFTNPIMVNATTPVTAYLYGSVISGATAGSGANYAHTFKVSSVTATGATTGNSIGSPSYVGSGQAMVINSGGTLTLSTVTGANATPSTSQLVSVGQMDGVYLAGRFTAQYEGQKITSLTLEAAGSNLNSNNIKNIRLYAQNGSGSLSAATMPFATISQFTCAGNVCSYTLTNNDNVLPMTINPGTPVTLFVKADIEGEGVANLGDDFYFRVQNGADVVAKGALSQAATSESGNFNDSATAKSFIVPFSVVTSGSYPTEGSSTTTTVAAGSTLARFKVSNLGNAQVTLTDFKVTDSGSNSLTVAGGDTYALYASNENGSSYLANALGNVDPAGAVSNWTGLTTTINGNSFRYFTVVLNDATGAASGDNWAFSVAALGDVKYSADETNLGYDGNQDGDLGDTISGLYTDGKPTVGTINKQ